MSKKGVGCVGGGVFIFQGGLPFLHACESVECLQCCSWTLTSHFPVKSLLGRGCDPQVLERDLCAFPHLVFDVLY